MCRIEFWDFIEKSSYITTILGLYYIAVQVTLQKKKDRLELILRLSNDFYNNDKLQGVFEYLDQDKKSVSEINQELEELIREGNDIKLTGRDNMLKEIHINIYFNFFNSIAILVQENVVEKELAMQLFRYQLEKTFCYSIMFKYMEDYGFEKLKLLLPDELFTYGTLSSPIDRSKIVELGSCSNDLLNNEQIVLSDFEIVDVHSIQIYKGMIPSKKGGHVLGTILKIKEKASWSELFSKLDQYEEVDTLYERKIIQINDTKKYVWTYLKKN